MNMSFVSYAGIVAPYVVAGILFPSYHALALFIGWLIALIRLHTCHDWKQIPAFHQHIVFTIGLAYYIFRYAHLGFFDLISLHIFLSVLGILFFNTQSLLCQFVFWINIYMLYLNYCLFHVHKFEMASLHIPNDNVHFLIQIDWLFPIQVALGSLAVALWRLDPIVMEKLWHEEPIVNKHVRDGCLLVLYLAFVFVHYG